MNDADLIRALAVAEDTAFVARCRALPDAAAEDALYRAAFDALAGAIRAACAARGMTFPELHPESIFTRVEGYRWVVRDGVFYRNAGDLMDGQDWYGWPADTTVVGRYALDGLTVVLVGEDDRGHEVLLADPTLELPAGTVTWLDAHGPTGAA